MIDARNVYRKVSRTINDFSPEQLANLSAIVWLHRGQGERFIALVQKYLAATAAECGKVPAALAVFEAALAAVRGVVDGFGVNVQKAPLAADLRQPAADALAELRAADAPDEADRAALLADLAAVAKAVPTHPRRPPPRPSPGCRTGSGPGASARTRRPPPGRGR